MEIYREDCRVSHSCEIFSFMDVSNPPTHQELVKNDCFRAKAHSCYCLTLEGGLHFNSNDFDFNDVSIYGNFCGWRNAAKKEYGKSLNWKNREEVLKAIRALTPIDELDSICKDHDIAYVETPGEICAADRKAISKMLELAYSTHSTPLPEVREQSLVMAEALYKNRWSCHLLELFKK